MESDADNALKRLEGEEQNGAVEQAAPPDPDKRHPFIYGSQPGRCGVCGRKASHTIHRRPKFHHAPDAEVNPRYWVDEKGCFRKVQPTK